MKHPLFFLAVAASLSAQTARAAEGQVYGGPVGGTDIRNAYIPSEPGFYFQIVGDYPTANRAYDQNGKVDKSINVSAVDAVGALGIAYVYPFEIFGASAISAIQGNYQAGYIKLNGVGNGIGAQGDPYVNFLALSWKVGQIFGEAPPPPDTKLPYGLVVQASYSMLLPFGYYDAQKVLTPGKNDFFYLPNFAATYLFGPNAWGDGLEVSARLFINIASKNPTTQYFSGLVLDTEFAISERVGRFQWGITGAYAKQIEDDRRFGNIVEPLGRRLEQFIIGPVVAYDFPEINSSIKLKVLFPVETVNSLAITRAILSYAMKF